MINKKKILVLVPNGASTDNRVVREAESLKSAGHEVLLAGLRLPHLSGLNAITANGVPVRRVDWQYRAYSKIAIVYAAVLIPLAIAIAAIIAITSYYLYFKVIAAGLAAVIDGAIQGLYAATNWFTQKYYPESSLTTANHFTLSGIRVSNPTLFHAMVLAILALIILSLRSIWKRCKREIWSSYGQLVRNPALVAIRRKAAHARNYGERENVRSYTVLERLLAPEEGSTGALQNRMTQHFILQSRTQAFIELGREFLPDLIHCHEIGTLPAGIALKTELRCKLIYEAHEIYDDLANASTLQSKRYRQIHEENIGKIDGFVTVNEDIGDYYKTTYPNIPTPVVMPNSVYPKSVHYDGRLHEAAGFPPDIKIILYQGGFSPNRGLNVLLESAYNLPEGWGVVFMGRGPLEDELKSEAENFQNKTIEKFKRKRSLQLLSHTETIEPILAAIMVDSRDGGGQTLQQAELEGLVVGQALLRAETGQSLGTDIRSRVSEIRETEVALAVDKLLRREIDELRSSGLINRARFVPMAPHSELVEWTSGASIGIIPYENIGLNHWFCSPNKVWEYPNAGVPILASRLHFLAKMIKTWQIGWTIASDPSVSEIVSVVRSISDKDIAEKKEACANFIASDNYTIHENRLLELVDSL